MTLILCDVYSNAIIGTIIMSKHFALTVQQNFHPWSLHDVNENIFSLTAFSNQPHVSPGCVAINGSSHDHVQGQAPRVRLGCTVHYKEHRLVAIAIYRACAVLKGLLALLAVLYIEYK